MLKKTIGLFILLVCGYAQPVLAGDIMISDPWVREAPPAARMLAGYFLLRNHDQKDHVLVSARSEAFAKVEMHLSSVQQGMMKMEKQDKITFLHGKEFHFKPGGYHLMLMKPKRKLSSGDKVEIILVFGDGKELPVTFTVRKAKEKPMQEMQHHHNH